MMRKARASYTLERKQEAVRRMQAGILRAVA